jgi:predicted AlkP superfamily phosphohydrolase/phosphomutase
MNILYSIIKINKGMLNTKGFNNVSPKEKVLLLGIDGATFDIIKPLVKNGKLPNLAYLMNEGAWGVLDSTIPPVTIPAWVSMMTGKNPGKLGMYDLLKRDGYGVQVNGYCYAQNEPVWKILNKFGIRTGILNLPGTYPPEKIDGFIVTGMLTPSKKSPFSYPLSLGADLDTTVLNYEIDVPQWQYFDEDAFIKDIYKITEKRAQAAEYLIKNIPCDFYMIVFTSSDRIHHLLWHKRNVIEAYWEELDVMIGRLLNLFGEETTVIIVSDHGFGNLEKTFFINEWLKRKGFLRAKREINERTLVKLGRLIEKFYLFLRERKLLNPVVSILRRFVSLDYLQKYTLEYLSNERLEGRVNWEKTKAFSCVHTPHFGQIYVNMEGKMGEGCVKEYEREELLKVLLKGIKDLTNPKTGKKLDVQAYLAKDVYNGPLSANAPDIVFILDGGKCEIDAKVGEPRLFADGAPLTDWKGTHTLDGVFIAKGPKIKKGLKMEKTTVFDISPTILRMFGIAHSDEMDGRVLNEIFIEDAQFSERICKKESEKEMEQPDLTEEEKALIEARLKNLGYI